jgi:hypothetical protein
MSFSASTGLNVQEFYNKYFSDCEGIWDEHPRY